MSRILDFRDNVLQHVKTLCPELREVDWYDGQFDIADLRNWTAKPPSAFIATSTGTEELVVTGESQIDLDCIMVVVDQDKTRGRDADRRVWEILERCVVDFRLQSFGDPNASAAWRVRARRLMDPVIRREGVAFGVVTWKSAVTVGTNRARERDQILGPDGNPIQKVPVYLAIGESVRDGETYNSFSDPDDFQPTELPPGSRGFFEHAEYPD